MSDEVQGWKIKQTSTGLYSSGGYTPSFTKRGKIWAQLGHLKSHLSGLDIKSTYKNCEVIEIVINDNQMPNNTINAFYEKSLIKKNSTDSVKACKDTIGKLLTDFVN